jgi:hypothetical protein
MKIGSTLKKAIINTESVNDDNPKLKGRQVRKNVGPTYAVIEGEVVRGTGRRKDVDVYNRKGELKKSVQKVNMKTAEGNVIKQRKVDRY